MNDYLIQKIKEARKDKGLKQSEVATLLGLKGNTLSNYENGISEPDIDTFINLCKIYELDYASLLEAAYNFKSPNIGFIVSGTERETLEKYRILDVYGKRAVDSILDIEHERVNHIDNISDTEITATLEYPTNLVDYDTLKETHAYKYETSLQGTTAGGYPLLALQEHEPRSVKTNIKCDYALLLKGNSMEPDYPNGCILLINRFFDFIDGDVCIVEIDVAAEMAETTCKKVYIKDNQVELVPINKTHDTQTYSINEIKIIGKVVGMRN